MNPIDISAIVQIASAVILVVTAIILWIQISETRRATYATAFKAVYDMLQDEAKRDDRGFVLGELAEKSFETWTLLEKKRAERVCYNYDAVGIICRNRLLPTHLVADSWGDSLRRCWKILAPLVSQYRTARNSNEFWDDFEWLARQAEQYQQRVHT
ncbi:MAG: hypothetical protein Q8O46_00330 [bacterium]|nr:hypothetical protein [bacterium]